MKILGKAFSVISMIMLMLACGQKKTLTVEMNEEAVSGYKIEFEYQTVVDPSALSDKVYYTVCRKNSFGELKLEYADKQDIAKGDTLVEGKVTGYIEVDGTRQVLSEYVLKDGLMEGQQIGYFSNGKKRSEVNYEQGRKNGKAIEWNTDGEVVSEIVYKDDEVVEVIKEKAPSQ